MLIMDNLDGVYYTDLGVRYADVAPATIDHVTLRQTLVLCLKITKTNKTKTFRLTGLQVFLDLQIYK